MNAPFFRRALSPSVAPPPAPAKPPRGPRLRAVADALLGKMVTLVLASVALLLGIATFVVLAGGAPLGVRPTSAIALVLANFAVLLLLGAVLAGRLTRVWVERRRGSAGSRLHVRLVLLFSVVAVTPAIVVAVFATVFFDLGIQAWFNDRVRTALQESLQVSRGYLDEHRNNIRADALGMANDLARAGRLLADDPNAFAEVLATQTALRGLTEAVIFEPVDRPGGRLRRADGGLRRHGRRRTGRPSRRRPAMSWCSARTDRTARARGGAARMPRRR